MSPQQSPAPLAVADLVAVLRSGGSWSDVLREALSRAREHARASPKRARSTRRWLLAAGVFGLAVLALAGAPWVGWVVFVPWYLLAATTLWQLQGYIRTLDGAPYHTFLLPNGLTWLRLSLAPIAAWPVLTQASLPTAFRVSFLLAMALLDLLDGQIARRRHLESRLGRMLDPTADIALMTVLAVALYQVDALGLWAFVIILVRYPGTYVNALLVIALIGPYDVESTWLGKVAGFVTSAWLSLLAVQHVLAQPLLPAGWAGPLELCVAALLSINFVYLFFRALGLRRTVAL